MNDVANLRLQIEWGADEALGEIAVDRLAPRAPSQRPKQAPERASNEPVGGVQTSLIPLPHSTVSPASRAQSLATAATTIAELRDAVAGFDGCALAATATNLVFSDGNPDAGLMLVGEGPGAEEDRAGRPFVGPSGRLLDRMLASIGLDRSQYVITNLIPWRPPGNRNPTDSEILMCLPFLLRHIALVRPRRLVVLGAIATRAIIKSNAGIRKTRGNWIDLRFDGLETPVPTLPMLHPAYLLRTPGAKRDAWADLRSLRAALDGDGSAEGGVK